MSKRGGMPWRARLATSGSESANKRGVYLDYDFFPAQLRGREIPVVILDPRA